MLSLTVGGPMQTEMSFLIDSNVIIAAEPFNGELEEAHPAVSSFLRLAAQNGHHVFVHRRRGMTLPRRVIRFIALRT